MINLINCETQPTENHRGKQSITELNFSVALHILCGPLWAIKHLPNIKIIDFPETSCINNQFDFYPQFSKEATGYNAAIFIFASPCITC